MISHMRAWFTARAARVFAAYQTLSAHERGASIVEYVIQQSIYKKVPVIGYNRFFYESGASLAFVIDYREVGIQCAHEARRVLAGAPCRQVAPVFQLWLNTRVMGKLGVAGPPRLTPPLLEGP